MPYRYLVLLSAALIVFSCGCKKKEGPAGPQGPVGPAGPAYYGSIKGHVVLNDAYGVRQYHDLDGILVHLTDSVSTLTDSTGYYQFDSVATGNYNLEASKAGYGATQSGHFAFVKDTLYKNLKMSARPGFDLTSFRASYSLQLAAYDSVLVTFNADTRIRNWIVFVSNKPSVSASDYLLAFTKSIPANATASAFRISAPELNNAGMFFGEIAYYAAYSYAVNDISLFDEPTTGRAIYTAVGTPVRDTAIAP